MSEDLIRGFVDRQEQGLGSEQAVDTASPEYAEVLARVQAAADSDSKDLEQRKVENVAWSSEDSLAAAQRFFSSAALGWGDDMALWTTAAINALPVVGTYARYGIETTVREQYDQLRSEYDAKQREFRTRQPGAALTAEIAGSIASPVNVLRTPVMAGRAAQAATTGDRVAAEGAVYGAGEAAEGERLQGAASGAASSLIGYGVLRGGMNVAGRGVSAFTRRNVEGNLIDDAGDFMPITLAASKPEGVEGAIHTFYRDVVAPSFGGKGVVKAQEKRVITPAKEFLEAQKEMSKKIDENLSLKIKEQEAAIRNAGAELEAQRKNLKAAQSDKNSTLRAKLSSLKSGDMESITAKATADVNRLLDARRFQFRSEAFSRAMPATANSSDMEKVLAVENIGDRIRELDALWSKKGYSMIKGKKIRFLKDQFALAVDKGIESDTVFRVLMPDISAFQKNVQTAIDSVDSFRNASGRIDGDVVATIRARLGTIAAAAGDPQLRKAYYMAQGKIDDIIEGQLTPAQKKAFREESQNWKTTVILRDAIEGTRTNTVKRGYFDESDWVSAASKNNQLDKRYGTGPLVKQALTLEQNLKTAEKSIAKRAANLAKSKARLIEQSIRQHTNQINSQLPKIDAQIAAKKNKLRNNPELAEDIARDIADKNAKEAEIKVLESQLKDLKQLRSPQNPSWFHTLAATGILAAVGGGLGFGAGPIGTAAGVAAGAALGRGFATPTAQRIVAGQTAPQMAAQRAIKSDTAQLTADILSRSIGRTGLLTGTQ